VSVLAGGAPTQAEERLLEALLPDGARLKVVDDGRVHPVERLVVVHPVTRRFAGHLHEPWRRLLDERLLPKRPRVKGQRIFISRRPEAAPRGRCVLNETELRPILRRAGFHRYFLEELTFDEQVELFYDAEAVVAPHGAGLANIMFSESIDVLELFPSPLVYPHYYVLATGMGHRWHRGCSGEPSNTTNFTVAVSDVVAWLERLESPAWT
jgi:capsular polysaccharide biosynthesis protein